MVTAIFKYYPDQGRLCMRISGHAGHGVKGTDVVCAGASMYAYGIAQCLEIMYDEGKLEGEPVLSISEARMSVSVIPKAEWFHDVLLIFWVAQTGLQLLAEAYPDHAKLKPFKSADEAVLEESST